MLYHLHDTLHAALAPTRLTMQWTGGVLGNPFIPASHTWSGRATAAWAEVVESFMRPRGKPAWDIRVGRGSEQVLFEQEADRTPFCRLLRFCQDGATGPAVLLAAPMSGHHATLLRGTVQDLADAGFDVYVTDWKDARIVPVMHGRFGLDEYIHTLIRFMHLLGPDVHVMAVCQPAPALVAAVSLMAARGDDRQPRSITLMGGPVDTRAAPTVVTRLAQERPIEWFERNLITDVPVWHPGAFRRVYPGFLQLGAFMSMNPDRHREAHLRMFDHLVRGDGESAAAHRSFYDEYLAVMDVPAEYYLETVSTFFQRHDLATGQMRVGGESVEPSAIECVALMTVEGELDDISAPGQTLAAHDMCSGIPWDKRANLLQPGVGHYGIFNGRRWRTEILPRVAEFMAAN